MVTPVALASVAAFNLVCTLTSGSSYSERDKSAKPEIAEMRIDLETKRFCIAECEETLPIQEVTPSHIVLFNAKTGAGKERFSWTISRETGRFSATERAENGDFISLVGGSCYKAPFTGFPPQRF